MTVNEYVASAIGFLAAGGIWVIVAVVRHISRAQYLGLSDVRPWEDYEE